MGWWWVVDFGETDNALLVPVTQNLLSKER